MKTSLQDKDGEGTCVRSRNRSALPAVPAGTTSNSEFQVTLRVQRFAVEAARSEKG